MEDLDLNPNGFEWFWVEQMSIVSQCVLVFGTYAEAIIAFMNEIQNQ
jgi:hypothetical protein